MTTLTAKPSPRPIKEMKSRCFIALLRLKIALGPAGSRLPSLCLSVRQRMREYRTANNGSVNYVTLLDRLGHHPPTHRPRPVRRADRRSLCCDRPHSRPRQRVCRAVPRRMPVVLEDVESWLDSDKPLDEMRALGPKEFVLLAQAVRDDSRVRYAT